jgi:DNA-binding GntR family transcriptional regulator
MGSSPSAAADDRNVVDALRALLLRITDDDGVIPGEPSLAAELGVSRPRLREALVQLEGEGLLQRRKGARSSVNRAGFDLTSRFDLQVDYAELLQAAGKTPTMELLEHGPAKLDTRAAHRLGRRAGDLALRTVKRWCADGEPAMVAVDLLVVPDKSWLGRLDPEHSVFDLVEQVWGEPLAWEIAIPGAIALDRHLARTLACHTGDPALTLQLVGVTGSANRVFSALEHHRPGIVEYGFVRTVAR